MRGRLAGDDHLDGLSRGIGHECEAGVFNADGAFLKHVVHQFDEIMPKGGTHQDQRKRPDLMALNQRAASNISSRVPKPPGIQTNAHEYLTSITLRAKK